ncbi:2OG-Fe(II) oxygenase [Gemmatimonas sp.]|uniref:2OG-Fe(II) oxygenase n=1 Tax=Gemmatimonas sp. TaxID=1962908 RepID=UPI003565BB4E
MLESGVFLDADCFLNEPGIGYEWVGDKAAGIMTVVGAFPDGIIERSHLLVVDAMDEIGFTGKTIGGLNVESKHSTDIHLVPNPRPGCQWEGAWSHDALSAIGYDLAEIDDGIFQGIGRAVKLYQALVQELTDIELEDTGYQFQRYTKGEGFYRSHVDCAAGDPDHSQRVLGVVVYLNTVNLGGQTYLSRHDTYVMPEAGKILLFPANWTHPHESMVPLSDDKFIVSTFIKTAERHDH